MGELYGADSEAKVTVRVPQDLLREFEDWYPGQDYRDRSEALRGLMREAVQRDDQPVPEDPVLRDVYKWLRLRADHRGLVDGSRAIPQLASRDGLDKQWVKDSRLEPLRQLGWIEVENGVIRLTTPS